MYTCYYLLGWISGFLADVVLNNSFPFPHLNRGPVSPKGPKKRALCGCFQMKMLYKYFFRRCYDIKMKFDDSLDLVSIPR